MDPVACWSAMWSAVEDEEWELAADCAAVLIDWADGGGFVPDCVRMEIVLEVYREAVYELT